MDTEDTITVHVRAFARLREVLESGAFDVELRRGATLADLWEAIRLRNRAVDAIASSTRLARNGRLVALLGEALVDGDDVALLPPVGGG